MTDELSLDESVQPTLDRIEMSPSELETDNQNPNSMGERQYEALKKNIKEFGFIVPVVVDSNNIIADGEHRLRAAKELSLTTIPVVQLDIDDPNRRILRQVMNKLAGDHDIHQDAQEFETILAAGRQKSDLAELLGQSERSIDGVLAMLDSDSSTEDTLDDVTNDDVDSSSSSSLSDSKESLGSPDAVDPDTMTFDHECPQCGYEW